MASKSDHGVRGKTEGFTLIEMLIVISIMGIGVLLAFSNLRTWNDHYNARGFHRNVFSELQEARIRASASASRHRIVVDLGQDTFVLQRWDGAAWNDVRRRIDPPASAGIEQVVPVPGGALSTGQYALVYNPSGEVYGQSNITDINTITPLTQATITFSADIPTETASITVFGWTGKARIN